MPPSDIAENPRAIAGGNNPPADPTPFDIASKAVEDIYAETLLWLDGHPIDSQDMADGVANLLAEIRKAEKLCDDTRKAEKAPLDEAIKEIQERYNPLIGDTKSVKGKTVLAAIACKAALQPWLDAQDRRLKEEARVARELAEQQRREAEEALRASDARNLAEREAAEALLREARKAEGHASAMGRQSATAGGDFGRAVGLRTTWVVDIDDPVIAARTCWNESRDEMLSFLREWAERQARTGRHAIPGFVITPRRTAA